VLTLLVSRQVMLYVLLMTIRDRVGAARAAEVRRRFFLTSFLFLLAELALVLLQSTQVSPTQGVILYISPEELKLDLICPSWTEMRALLLSRNALAGYIRDAAAGVSSNSASKSPLPPLLRDAHECQYCYQAAECVAHHAGLENGSAATSGMSDLYSYILKGVTPQQLRYYRHWDDLINLEHGATQSTDGALGGEASDRSLRDLSLTSCNKIPGSDSYLLYFARPSIASTAESEGTETVPEALTGIAVNDRVQVSAVGGVCSADAAAAAGSTNDIEDLCKTHFRAQSRVIMDAEVNLCAGTVQDVTRDAVQIIVSEDPKRLRRYVLCCQCAARNMWLCGCG
jgi:hypothetical protein